MGMKKLGYAPLPAPVPKWVKRAVVNHNNSMENFMLFALAVFFCVSNGVEDKDIRVPATAYFCFRVYYSIFTVIPEIFMMKTACWFMGWLCCAWIFCAGLDKVEWQA